jgi:hypothetical protein
MRQQGREMIDLVAISSAYGNVALLILGFEVGENVFLTAAAVIKDH